MPRTKLEEIIKSFEIKEFSQFFRLKTRTEGNFRPGEERLSQYDDADFFDFIKLGQIEFSESQRLIVAGAMANKDLSERSGKKAQYEKAKKMLRELSVYSAGIFIFYDNGGNFRFSLIYPESVGTRREWSNFRRFTYFVSKELTNKTFLQRIGDGNFSTLDKVKDAFSVEKVTKEFYLEYRKLFDGLLENLSKNHTFLNEASKNNINTENFAKKLLGQIVFLYFIQKKGWIGVPAGGKWGEGDRSFMGNLYKEATIKGANFYNDYLEKLFYNALNNSHRDSADPSFSKDFNSRIPFLNGGLFEAEYDWKNSLMYLDNKVFQSMFDAFERYNFTVEEESPDDKEIAVDPEMLGKVFENLLPENLRKGKGTYYTPREIVYYMCRESLVNYLVSNHSNITEENIRNYIFYSESFENFKKQKGESFTPGQWKELDDLLINIKVCDPACGSGAFLVGMLNMIVKLRIFLQTTPDSQQIPQKKEYELKREAIQNCIYGVDIDPGAIEIAKLRLWLALVVDYDLEDIEPLPNLDYRLMCGNSLLEEFEGVKFYNGENELQATLLPVEPEKQKKVEALKNKVKEYFSVHDDKDKLKKRKEINDIKDWLVRSALEKRRHELTAQHKGEEAKANMLDEKSRKKYLAGFSKWLDSSSNIQRALESLHNPKKEKPFFIWKLEFVDVFEDKKGFDIVIANPPYVDSERMTLEMPKIRELISGKYTTAKGNWDLYIPFWELGFKIINDDGNAVFITPNKWLAIGYGKELRALLRPYVYKIGNCDLVQVFEAGNSPVVVFASKFNKSSIQIDKFQTNFEVRDELAVGRNLLTEETWGFLLSEHLDLILKIKATQQRINSAYHAENPFTVSEAYEFQNILTDLKTVGYFRSSQYLKFVNTGTIEKYYFLWSIGTTKYLKKKYNVPVVDKKVFDSKFPKRFAQMKEPKLIISGMRHFECAFDASGDFVAGKSTVILKSNGSASLFIPLAIFNSTLISFYIKESFGVLGIDGGINFTAGLVENLPLPNFKKELSKKVIILVEKILEVVKDRDFIQNTVKQTKVKEYEKQIDRLVYNLYNLSPDEIEIVENFERRAS